MVHYGLTKIRLAFLRHIKLSYLGLIHSLTCLLSGFVLGLKSHLLDLGVGFGLEDH